MQDQFVGDIGDFAKFSLLRYLCGMTDPATSSPDLKLGVVWYYNRYPRKGGGHVHYPACQHADPDLYKALQSLLPCHRYVCRLESLGILPVGTRYFREEMTYPPKKSARQAWLDRAAKKMQGADLVYLDPDTGLVPESKKGKAHTRAGAAYAYEGDVTAFWQQGHSMVIYQDTTQGGNDTLETICRKMREILAATDDKAKVVALRWSIARPRVFFIAIQPKHRSLLLGRIGRLSENMTADCFERITQDNVDGGAR